MKIFVTVVSLFALFVPALQAWGAMSPADLERAIIAKVAQSPSAKQNKMLPTAEQRARFAKHVKSVARQMEENGLDPASMAYGIGDGIHTLYALEKDPHFGDPSLLNIVEKRALDYAVFVWFKDEHKQYATKDKFDFDWTDPYPEYYLTKEEDKEEGGWYAEPLPEGSWKEYEEMVEFSLEYVLHQVEMLDAEFMNYQHIVLKTLTH
ncbi:MAG: hypothetical protein IKA93_02910 [Elusimicrobiaceae bacterium]|nr:hypothetical protein [Elusimicrobiaceae bacterium]